MTITTSHGLTAADIDRFDPRHGARFSPNLFAYLSARDPALLAMWTQVYRDQEDVLWIGYVFDGDFIGARLMRVLSVGVNALTASWTKLGPLSEIPDFWERYAAVGRCAIDVEHGQHFVGSETRWSVAGESRSCQWCSACTQTRHRWIETVHHERWSSAPANGA